MSTSIRVFLIDHLRNSGWTNMAPVTVSAFKEGKYNGDAVVILVNGEPQEDDYVLAEGDRISVTAAANKGASDPEVFLIDHLNTQGRVTVSGTVGDLRSARYEGAAVVILVQGEKVEDDYVIQNGDRISVTAASNKGA